MPVELNLKCQGPLVSAAEPSDVYRVLSTEPNKEGIAEVINVQVTHPVSNVLIVTIYYFSFGFFDNSKFRTFPLRFICCMSVVLNDRKLNV